MLKSSFSQSLSFHSHLLLTSWNLTTRCLAVNGSGSIGKCRRLSQLAGFQAHYNIVISNLLTIDLLVE